MKLFALLEHFQEHKTKTPNLSFVVFYKMYFGEESGKHMGDHDHSKLPGKQACNHLHAPVPAVLPVAALTNKNTPAAAQTLAQALTVCPTLATPEVEQFVTYPIENAVRSISGVVEVNSFGGYLKQKWAHYVSAQGTGVAVGE